MKSSVETLSPTRVKVTVDVPFSEIGDSVEQAYQRIGAQVTIPGFRPGKVPSRVIDQRVGRGAVLEEAINEALPKAYEEAIEEASIVAVGQPEVEVTEVNDPENFVFTAEVDVRPEFDLPDYAGIAVSVDDTEITDADVEEQLDELRKRFGTVIPVERAAADDDVVLIDVEGFAGDTKLDDYSATALSYEVGSGGMVDGADEALRGLSVGESATFTFTPEEGDQVGNELTINVTVQAVRERSLPDADDEFAQLASEFDTLDELRTDLRTRVERMKLVEQGMAARELVLEKLLESVEIPVPESLMKAQVDEHFEDGHGDDDHRGEVVENAERSIRTQFILDKIADTEELAVNQAELTQWLVTQAPRYGMEPDQFADALVQAGQVPMAVADVRRGKALALALQKAEVTDASGREVNLAALDQAEEEEAAEFSYEVAEDEDEIEAEMRAEIEAELIEEAIEEAIVEEIVEEAIVEEIVEEAIVEELLEEAEAEAEAEATKKPTE